METKELKSNELRIGNYYWSGYNCKIIKLKGFIPEDSGYEIEKGVPFTGYLIEGCDKLIPWGGLDPIELTEEWLLKLHIELGLKKRNSVYEWTDGNQNIQINPTKKGIEIYLCGYDSATSSQCFIIDHIKYVHQLQDLLFSLDRLNPI